MKGILQELKKRYPNNVHEMLDNRFEMNGRVFEYTDGFDYIALRNVETHETFETWVPPGSADVQDIMLFIWELTRSPSPAERMCKLVLSPPIVDYGRLRGYVPYKGWVKGFVQCNNSDINKAIVLATTEMTEDDVHVVVMLDAIKSMGDVCGTRMFQRCMHDEATRNMNIRFFSLDFGFVHHDTPLIKEVYDALLAKTWENPAITMNVPHGLCHFINVPLRTFLRSMPMPRVPGKKPVEEHGVLCAACMQLATRWLHNTRLVGWNAWFPLCNMCVKTELHTTAGQFRDRHLIKSVLYEDSNEVQEEYTE